MFEAQANYRQTFFFFGSMNWIIKDIELNSFLVWSTNRWHSICVAFDRTTSHITFVKVKIYFLLFPYFWRADLLTRRLEDRIFIK